MVCHSLSYYWKDTRLKVYIWQPFEARIIETWRPNNETPGLHFNYCDPSSAIQILRSYWYGGSAPTENNWKVKRKVKVKLWKSSYASVGSWQWKWKEVPLLLWWKVQKSAMKMWAVATPHSRWTTWICLPTSCGCCQGDLGEDGLDLHFFWHAGDHHWNPILFPLFQLSRPHQEFWAQ